jgi:predicted nucleotidyltransferase
MNRHEQDYLAVLQRFSKPARETVQVTWLDEGQFDFDFKPNSDAVYRYWDATACVEFGFQMAEFALEEELKQEAKFLERYDDIVKRVNEQVDVRGSDLDILVISCMDNKGVLSKNKRKKYGLTLPEETLDFIESTVRSALDAPHSLDPATKAAVRRFLSLIACQYDVNGAILYGSRARGDHRSDSDVDVAVLLNGKHRQTYPIVRTMYGVTTDVLLETGIDISPLPVWMDQWNHPETHSNPGLLHNIAREGIRF